jgi:hypothetical protein
MVILPADDDITLPTDLQDTEDDEVAAPDEAPIVVDEPEPDAQTDTDKQVHPSLIEEIDKIGSDDLLGDPAVIKEIDEIGADHLAADGPGVDPAVATGSSAKPKPYMVSDDLIKRPLRHEELFDEGAL